MATQQLLAAIGTGLGTVGSIVTAFGLNRAVGELAFARQTLYDTVKALAENQANIVIATGHDQRIRRAIRGGNYIVWIGIVLLSIGLMAQVTAIFAGTPSQAPASSP